MDIEQRPGRSGPLVPGNRLGTPLPILYNESAVVVHVFFALMVLPLATSIERIDRSLEAAANTLAAGRFRTAVPIIGGPRETRNGLFRARNERITRSKRCLTMQSRP